MKKEKPKKINLTKSIHFAWGFAFGVLSTKLIEMFVLLASLVIIFIFTKLLI